jgi:pyruvate/2-oxoglutarate dehydrogenase complex dihydrolipoamide dehydrogenase (E3) component
LGARVTVLEAFTILSKDDPELVELMRRRLDGIDLREGVKIARIERDGGGVAVSLQGGEIVRGSHLLVAAGRQPNIEGLDLEKAGIEHSPKGIVVDARLRTTNRHVFAMGDVAGGPQFTHVAGYHAGIVIRNALFRLPAKVDYRALPWVTYTEPELAQVGLTEAQAREQHGAALNVLRWPLHENDRAQAERETHGLVKVVTRKNGTALGASILAPHAGELIQVWCLAITKGLGVKALSDMIAPYPTLGEASKRAAGSYFIPSLFSERTKKIVRFLRTFG